MNTPQQLTFTKEDRAASLANLEKSTGELKGTRDFHFMILQSIACLKDAVAQLEAAQTQKGGPKAAPELTPVP